MAYLRKEAQEIGWEEGHAAGMEAGVKIGMKAMIEALLTERFPNERIIEKLVTIFGYSKEQALLYLTEFE